MPRPLLTCLGRLRQDPQGYRVTYYDFGGGAPRNGAEGEEARLALGEAVLDKAVTRARLAPLAEVLAARPREGARG